MACADLHKPSITEASMSTIRQEADYRSCQPIGNLPSQKGTWCGGGSHNPLEEVEEIVEIDGSAEIVHEVPHSVGIELPLLQSVVLVLAIAEFLGRILHLHFSCFIHLK